jgi:hypothetical protein
MSTTQQHINSIPGGLTKVALTALFAGLGSPDVDAYPLYVGAPFTTGLTIAADGTTGISITSAFSGTNMISLAGSATGSGLAISGACATPVNITGAFTTGLTIAADGTTGISITSAFSGVTGFSFAGTASGDGILVSGACADGIHISGTNTASGLHISGDQVDAILIDGDAAADNGIKILVDDGITIGCGLNIDRTGTTGICTTGISVDTDGTTGIEIAAGFTGVTGLSIAGTASGDGILVSGACADGVHISGSNTATGLHISGDQVDAILIDGDAAANNGIKILVDDGITIGCGLNIDRSGTTGICTTGISIDTDGTTGIEVAAGFTGTNMISLAGTSSGSGVAISGACATPINITGAFTTGINVAADGTTGITVTSAFSGVTAIALAGTGSLYGLNISGDHTTGINIGAQTTAGLTVSGATAKGISIVGACSTAAIQMGVSGTTAGDFIWYGTTALYKVLFDADGDTNGAVYIGADTKGLMFNLYGDVTGCGVFWDPSTDTNGTLSVGASGGSKGVDFTAYGTTNGCSMAWDQSADKLVVTRTTATATATNLMTAEVLQTLTGASAVNTAEAFRSVLTSNVQVGTWANAILGKLDFSTAGFVTGLSAPICAEIDLGAGVVSAGAYYCYEAELVVGSVGGLGGSNKTGFMVMNASGAGVATWRTGGYVFELTGLGNAASSSILQTNTDQATHAIRILIDGTPYYMLMTTADNGTE